MAVTYVKLILSNSHIGESKDLTNIPVPSKLINGRNIAHESLVHKDSDLENKSPNLINLDKNEVIEVRDDLTVGVTLAQKQGRAKSFKGEKVVFEGKTLIAIRKNSKTKTKMYLDMNFFPMKTVFIL